MQTALVLVRLKVLSPELDHPSIIPPEKAKNDNVEEPGDDDLSPLRLAPDIAGGNLHDPFGGIVVGRVSRIDGDENSNADDGEGQEHVATHADKA